MPADLPASPLVAPSWVRWVGGPVAVSAGLVVGLTSSDAGGRLGGVIVAGFAAVAWTAAVALGAVQVRRRGQSSPRKKQIIRTIAAALAGSVAANTLPFSEGHPVFFLANFLSGAIGGFAIASAILLTVKRRAS